MRANHELTGEQYAAIDSRLDYLGEAAKRTPRVDWRNLALGTLLGLVVQVVVPPEPIRDVLFILFRGLADMFGSEIPVLPGPPQELT